MKYRANWLVMHLVMMVGALVLATSPTAVELSPSGEGGALIFPIWATTNGHLSVLSVVDSQHRRSFLEHPTQAVKLLLRDAQGQLLFGANLYLHNGEDSWTASIVSLPGGRSRLASSDDSCVLVDESGAAAPWSGSVELDADHGFIELIVMATLPGSATSADPSCTGLAQRWNTGPWSQDPAAGLDASNIDAALRGTLNLVNVPKGTSYTIHATALREFSDIPQHTLPSATLPDLASAHDSGTAQDATRSRVCDARQCLEDTWASPRDAVAAALMASNVRGEFANSLSLGGRSDLVFSYPLRHHYSEGVPPHLNSPLLNLYTFDRDGHLQGGSPPCPYYPGPPGCELRWDMRHVASLEIVSFPDVPYTDVVPSEVLGISAGGTGSFQHAAPAEGQFRAYFEQRLTSNSGHNYFGMPVIGVVLQQFENGNLAGDDGVQQRANYGVAVPMTRQISQ